MSILRTDQGVRQTAVSGASSLDAEVAHSASGNDRFRLRSWQGAVLFLSAYLVYQTSLAATAPQPYPDFWLYGCDSYRMALTRVGSHPMANYQTTKHPMFVAVELPLHRAGTIIFSGLPEPYAENFALSFPGALLGALNVCLAYVLFQLIGFRRNLALFPTILYGASASIWMFSSFPETYICTTLFTNLFLFLMLTDTEGKKWARLSLANAVACFCTPQQILLALIPVFNYLYREGLRPGMRKALRYAAALALLFVAPYLLFLASIGSPEFAYAEFFEWAALSGGLSGMTWFAVSLTFLVCSQIALAIPPNAEIAGAAILSAGPAWWVPTILIAIYTTVGVVKNKCRWPFALAPSLLVFCAAYIAFFVVWQPQEAFLYSAPFVLPAWLLIHGGHVAHQESRIWKVWMFVACFATISLNGNLILGLWSYHMEDWPQFGRVR